MLISNFLFFATFLISLLTSPSFVCSRAVPSHSSLDSIDLGTRHDARGQRSHLQKRVTLVFSGANAGNQQNQQRVRRAFNEVIALSQLIVDTLQPNHTPFLRFFHDGSHFNDVVSVFRVLADLAHSGNTITIDLPDEDGPVNAGIRTNAQYFHDTTTIRLFRDTLQRNFLTAEMPPPPILGTLLNNLRYTLTGEVFHELIHFAGDNYRPNNQNFQILDRGIYEAAQAAGISSNDPLLSGIPLGQQAYGHYAATLASVNPDVALHNDDNYTMMAMAIYAHFECQVAFPPPANHEPTGWGQRNDSDVLANANIPDDLNIDFAHQVWGILKRPPPGGPGGSGGASGSKGSKRAAEALARTQRDIVT